MTERDKLLLREEEFVRNCIRDGKTSFSEMAESRDYGISPRRIKNAMPRLRRGGLIECRNGRHWRVKVQ